MKLFAPLSDEKRAFRFGWYGDSGMGEYLLQKIMSGEKTATACPAYDPPEAAVGEFLRLVDKSGKSRGTVRITDIEYRTMSEVDEDLAKRLGATLDQMQEMASFANSRSISAEETIRITHFELISKE